MYNVHQYNQTVRTQERLKYQEQQYAKYLLKHEDFKEQALDKTQAKAHTFVKEQSDSPKHFVFQDDHFASWRPHKQYRDVQDSNKFLSFKAFRHRPNYDMDKYFNQRQRKQIRELSERKQELIQSKVIPEQQRSRSLRCQGPLNPKIQFRERKKDHQYLQPRLRYTNVTDKQRQNESAFSFDDKFKSLYSSYQMTKSKIGRTTISLKRSKRYQGRDALDFIEEANSQMSTSKPFYFNKEDNQPEENDSQLLRQSKEMSFKSNSQSTSPKKKTYFKMAKTLQLKSQDPHIKEQIQQLLKKTQYERNKHLTNIVLNNTSENFFKKPIL